MQLLERKRYEVSQLEQAHTSEVDPFRMRLSYVAEQGSFAVARSLRLFVADEGTRRMSVFADLKRTSPTSPTLPRRVGSYGDAGARSEELFQVGCTVVAVNTDTAGWGGSLADLDSVVAARKKRIRSSGAPAQPNGLGNAGSAVVCKDLIIHPLQAGPP